MTDLAVMALAVPRPSEVADVFELCTRTELMLPDVTDVGEAYDAKAKFMAIDAYLAHTSQDGRTRLNATMRRLEARIGELIGTPYNGGDRKSDQFDRDRTDPLSPNERQQFRLMAAHPEVVEAVIANANDHRPPSRRKVVAAIRAHIRDRKKEEMAGDPAMNGRLEKFRTCVALGLTADQIADELDITKAYVNILAQRARVALTPNSRLAREERIATARRMAVEGHTSRQIATALNITLDRMSVYKNKYHIDIPADTVVGRTGRIDPARVLQETTFALEGLAMGLGMIDLAGFDHPDLPMWRTSMKQSIKTISKYIEETR